MKSYFGEEYPEAITVAGVRMPRVCERRWTRSFAAEDRSMWHSVSRFMDGSATITLPELASEWSSWSEVDRLDFCGACSWLSEQSDFPEMLRYIMHHGDPVDWAGIAHCVGTRLPQGEAFDLLTRALHCTELEEACNVSHGISLTKHPDSERVIREHLAALWSHPSLWDDDDFNNWFAYGATCCIEHLIAVGAAPQDFAEQVRALAAHSCAGNRDSSRRFLSKHYPWLNDETAK